MDQDLLLAIALSQTLMDEQDLYNQQDITSARKEYLEGLIEHLRPDAFEESKQIAKLDTFIEILRAVEGQALSHDQILFWVQLVEATASILVKSPASQDDVITVRSRVESACGAMLSFCLSQMELIGQTKDSIEDKMDVRTQLFLIIEILCFPDRAPIGTSVSHLVENITTHIAGLPAVAPVPIPPTETTRESEEDEGISHITQRLLHAPPAIGEVEKGATGVGFDSWRVEEPVGIYQKNSTSLFRNLSGVSRLFHICCSQVLNNGVVKAKEDLLRIKEQAVFISKLLDFLNEQPNTILPDSNSGAAIVHFISCLLSISQAEHELASNVKGKGDLKSVVKRFYLEDALDILCDKSQAGENVFNNAQLLIVSKVFEALDKRKLSCPDTITSGWLESLSELPKSMDMNIILLGVELIKELCSKDTLISTSSLLSKPSWTTTQFQLGNKIQLDCLSTYSPKDLVEMLFTSLAPNFLDTLFVLLLSGYMSCSSSSSISSSSGGGRGAIHDSEEDIGFQNLFEDADTLMQEGISVDEPSSIMLDLIKDVLSLFEGTLFQGQNSFISLSTRKQFSKNHLDALWFIMEHQSSLAPPVISTSRSGVAVLDVRFINTLRAVEFKLIANDFITDSMQLHVLEKVGLTKGWSLVIPREPLTFIVRLLARRLQALQRATEKEEDSLAISIWESFLRSVKAAITDTKDHPEQSECINFENVYLMLFLFHTFNPKTKGRFLTQSMNVLLEVQQNQIKRSPRSQIAAYRILLIIDYIYHNFDQMPEALSSRFETVLLPSKISLSLASNEYVQSVVLSMFKTTFNKMREEESQQSTPPPFGFPVFYLLPTNRSGAFSETARKILQSNKYDQFFSTCCALLNVQGHSGPPARAFLLQEYCFHICWEFLADLPLSASLIRKENPLSLGDGNIVLHKLRWLARLHLVSSSEYDSSVQRLLPPTAVDMPLKVENVLNLLNECLSALGAWTDIRVNSILDAALLLLENLLHQEDLKPPKKRKKEEVESLNLTSILKQDAVLAKTLLATLGGLGTCLAEQLREYFRLKFSERIAEKPDSIALIDLALSCPVSSDTIANVMGDLDMRGVATWVSEWGTASPSSFQFPNRDCGISTRVYNHPTTLDKSLKTYSVTSNQLLLHTVSRLIESSMGIIKASQTQKESMPPVLPFMDILHDMRFQYLWDTVRSYLSQVLDVDELDSLLDLHSMHSVEKALHMIAKSPKSPLETLCLDTLTFISEMKNTKAPLFYQYFLGTNQLAKWAGIPGGNFGVFFELLLNNLNEPVNERIFQLLCSVLQPRKETEDSMQLKRLATTTLLKFDDAFLANLFGEKLLGIDDKNGSRAPSSESVRVYTVQFVKCLLANKENKLGERLYGVFGAMFRKSFFQWNSSVKDFFTLFRDIAIEYNQLNHFVLLLVESLSSYKVDGEVQTQPLNLILQFLHAVLECESLPAPSTVEPMEESTAPQPQQEGAPLAEELMEIDTESTEASDDLDSKLCTFTVTQNNFMEQHWYYCYSCGFTSSEGICSICAQVCHEGHDVSYARYSRFFCDCGANPTRGMVCKALKPRPHQPRARSSSSASASKVSTTGEDHEIHYALDLPQHLVDAVKGALKEQQLVHHLHVLYGTIFSFFKEQKQTEMQIDSHGEDLFSDSKKIETKEIFKATRQYKAGLFDVRFKFNVSESNALRSALANSWIARSALSTNSSQKMAVAEGDSITITDPARLLEEGVTPLEKIHCKVLSRTTLGFEAVGISFNRECDNYLAVTGIKQCRVLCFNSSYQVSNQLELNLALDLSDPSNIVIQSIWLPGSQVHLAVITQQFIKIYDLSKDNISPVQYFSLKDEKIQAATFVHSLHPDTDESHLVIMSVKGNIFSQKISDPSKEAQYLLSNPVKVPSNLKGKSGGSLFYSPQARTLFCTYSDGKCFMGRLDASCNSFVSTCLLALEAADVKNGPFSNWIEFPDVPGLIVSISKKPNNIFAMQMKTEEVQVQYVNPSAKASGKVEGIAAITQPPCLVVLMEDGSVHRMDMIVLEQQKFKSKPKAEEVLEYVKQKARLKPKPTFPLTFFEKVQCITPSITLAGDITQHYTSEVAKQRLASSEDYLVSPKKNEFKIVIQNPNPDTVMVGLRVLLGGAAVLHIPGELKVFDRVIETSEGVRRWYDIPFMEEESLTADKQFTLRTSASYNNKNEPIIDSLEVYGLSKADFHWTEKMEKFESEILPKDAADSTQKSLEKILIETVHLLTACSGSIQGPVSQQLLETFAPILSDYSTLGFLRPSVKALILNLEKNHSDYYAFKDKVQLTSILHTLETSTYIDPDVFARFTKAISRIAAHRRTHLAVLLSNPSFGALLLKHFSALCSRKKSNFTQIHKVLSNIVGTMYHLGSFYVSKDMRDQAKAVDSLIEDLIFSNTDYIRSITAQELSGLLLPVFLQGSQTSAVHYSCDLCGQMPIKGKRWSCDVCQDFDLCDACHAKGAEFPPPHAKDHKMVDYVIQEDAVQEPLHLIPSDVDPTDEQFLMELAIQMSMQGEKGGLPDLSKMSHGVRDHRLAFQKMILVSLLEKHKLLEIRGGTASLAYMQLIYCLIRASCGTPSSHKEVLDALNKSFLEALMNDPSFDVQKASPKLEVEILWLRMITLLLQPALGDKEPALSFAQDLSKHLLAKGIVEFSLKTLEQLQKVEPTPASNQEESFGALLSPWNTPTEEKPQHTLMPFFNDDESTNGNLFGHPHQQLQENIFKMLSFLHKQKEGAEQFSKKWITLLCRVINDPRTPSAVRSSAKKLLLSICKTKPKYYYMRDSEMFRMQLFKLNKLSEKTNKFSRELSYDETVELIDLLSKMNTVASTRPHNWQQYCIEQETSLEFLFHITGQLKREHVHQLLKLLALAFASEESLEKSKKKKKPAEPQPIPTPMELFASPRSSHSLLMASPSEQKKERSRSGKENSSKAKESKGKEKKKKKELRSSSNHLLSSKISTRVSLFLSNHGSDLSNFINLFLLESNVSDVRLEAFHLLLGLWEHSSKEQRHLIFSLLSEKLGSVNLPSYGRNLNEFIELLGFIISKQESSKDLTDFTAKLLEVFRDQNNMILTHPNSHIYNTLESLVQFSGYYLESEPCLVCNDPEVPWFQVRLDTLKAETKFTDSAQIVRFNNSYLIQSISLRVSEIKKAKMVKSIHFYYNTKTVADASELKNKWDLWKKAKSVVLSPHQSEVQVDFPIPITVKNLLIEYASFYENITALDQEKLMCPRCNRVVTDKHGICSRCRENAYQCRQCRNINYENLEAFLCNECGYCKWAKFDYSFHAKASLATEKMETDEDKSKGLATIDKESQNAHSRYQQLMEHKKSISRIISNLSSEVSSEDAEAQILLGSSGSKVNRNIAALATIYEKECKSSFESLSKSVQVLLGTRRELVQYSRRAKGITRTSPEHQEEFKVRPPNRCFGCANAFVEYVLSLFELLAGFEHGRTALVSSGIIQELMNNNLRQGKMQSRADVRRVIVLLTKDDTEATKLLNSLMSQRIEYGIDNYQTMDLSTFVTSEMQLLSESVQLTDSMWGHRLRMVLDVFFKTAEKGYKNPVMCEYLILPCLNIIADLCRITPAAKVESVNDSVEEMRSAVEKKKSHKKDEAEGMDIVKDKTPTTTVPTEPGVNLPKEVTVSYVNWNGEDSFERWKARHEAHLLDSTALSPREQYLTQKYSQKWKNYLGKKNAPMSDLHTVIEGSWVKKLLLCESSRAIRHQCTELVRSFCQASVARTFSFLDLLAFGVLPEAAAAGDTSTEFFQLFQSLIQDNDRKVYLAVKGFVAKLFSCITREIESIQAKETSYTSDLAQGLTLKYMLDILVSFMDIPTIKEKAKREHYMEQLLDGFLSLRGINVQRTKLIEDSCKVISNLLDKFKSESEEDKKTFVFACVKALSKHTQDRTSIFILEQLSNIVCPAKPEPVYQLILNKSGLQEEYIRGNMTNNPYSSSDVGPLMRDVKNKICTTLDLRGLLEDDNSMELLVCNKIIKLDLTISQVFKHVWRRSLQQQEHDLDMRSQIVMPMVVVYRLQGLDGEATEEIVESLPEDTGETLDPEEEYKISAVLSTAGGLAAIVKIIENIRDFDVEYELAFLALKILYHCCKIKVNRRAVLALRCVDVLLKKLQSVFSSGEHANLAEFILLTIESIVQEANTIDKTDALFESKQMEVQETEGASQMKMFLEKLSSPLVSSSPKIIKTCSRILPFLTYGKEAIMTIMVDYFLGQLQYETYDGEQSPAQTLAMDCFAHVCENITLDSIGEKLKQMMMDKGMASILLSYLQKHYPIEVDSSSEEWNSSLAAPSLPYVLQQLTGLAQGFIPIQKFILDQGLIRLIHKLEKTTSVKKIGNLAENLMEVLRGPESSEEVRLAVESIRDEEKQKKLSLAELHRKKILKEFNLTASGSGKVTTDRKPLGIEELEEESGLKCMVCQEGYTFRPQNVLGIYTFSKRRSMIGMGPNSASGLALHLSPDSHNARAQEMTAYTTVTHFNIIHVQCHQEATRAEKNLKPPRGEWEGATIRNQHTKCNNLFPIMGPTTPLDIFNSSVEKYWSNLASLGRCDAPRYSLLVHDLKFLLQYYANEESLSLHSQGGGRESNIKFIPFVVFMGLFVLDQKMQRKVHEKSLSQFLQQPPESWANFSFSTENVYYMATSSLFVHTLEEWKDSLVYFLKRFLLFVHVTRNSAKKPKVGNIFNPDEDYIEEEETSAQETGKEESLFKSCRNALIFLCMIDKLQHIFKKPSEKPPKASLVAHSPEDQWIVDMKATLKNEDTKMIQEMTNLLKSYEEDLLAFEDFQEFFDELGVLAQVLQEAPTVDQFITKLFRTKV